MGVENFVSKFHWNLTANAYFRSNPLFINDQDNKHPFICEFTYNDYTIPNSLSYYKLQLFVHSFLLCPTFVVPLIRISFRHFCGQFIHFVWRDCFLVCFAFLFGFISAAIFISAYRLCVYVCGVCIFFLIIDFKMIFTKLVQHSIHIHRIVSYIWTFAWAVTENFTLCNYEIVRIQVFRMIKWYWILRWIWFAILLSIKMLAFDVWPHTKEF